MDVKKLLLDTLAEAYQLPVILQGSLSDDEVYPKTFFTYFNNYSDDNAFYDNNATEVVWSFDLNVYATDPATVNTLLLDAKQLMKSVGFIPDGSGHDLISDEPTHVGRGLTLLYIEKVR